MLRILKIAFPNFLISKFSGGLENAPRSLRSTERERGFTFREDVGISQGNFFPINTETTWLEFCQCVSQCVVRRESSVFFHLFPLHLISLNETLVKLRLKHTLIYDKEIITLITQWRQNKTISHYTQ